MNALTRLIEEARAEGKSVENAHIRCMMALKQSIEVDTVFHCVAWCEEHGEATWDTLTAWAESQDVTEAGVERVKAMVEIVGGEW